MKAWWAGLSPRERGVLLGGAVSLAVILVYFLGWEPLAQRAQRLQAQVAEQRQTLRWMEGAAEELARLRAAGGRRPAGGQSLLAVVDRSARAGGLADALKRVQPEGEGRARVWLDGASFDALVTWLEGLARRQGIRARAVSVEARAEPGRVDARLVLEAAP